MTIIKRGWDLLSKDQRRSAINAIIQFYATERGETVGVIAAEELLDMVLQVAGKHLYNRGVEDTTEFVQRQFEAMGMEIEISVKK